MRSAAERGLSLVQGLDVFASLNGQKKRALILHVPSLTTLTLYPEPSLTNDPTHKPHVSPRVLHESQQTLYASALSGAETT